MKINSMGDGARSYVMQSQNTSLKQQLQRLTLEISTGQIADIRDIAAGNTEYLNDLERSLGKLDSYSLATLEAGQFAGGVQTALTHISAVNSSFQATLLTASNTGYGDTSAIIIQEAKTALGQVIGALNTSVGGRTIFSGTATGTSPVASSEELLAALRGAMAGAGSVDDMLAAAQAWFADPAGFSTLGYLGSDKSLAPVSLSDEEAAQFELRADNPALRDTLLNLTVAALTDDPALGLTRAQQGELFQKTAVNTLNSNAAIIDLQSMVGYSEHQIEALSVQQSTQRTTIELARSELLSIDPYQAATELEQVQFQLQSLYAITSRMSQLSLVNYL